MLRVFVSRPPPSPNPGLTPAAWLAQPYMAFCEQNWNQARRRERKSVAFSPPSSFQEEDIVVLFGREGWAGRVLSLSGVQVRLVFSTCSRSGPASVPHQAALIASIGQQLAKSCYTRITWRAC